MFATNIEEVVMNAKPTMNPLALKSAIAAVAVLCAAAALAILATAAPAQRSVAPEPATSLDSRPLGR